MLPYSMFSKTQLYRILLLVILSFSISLSAQTAEITRIQINQAVAGPADNPVTEFVAGKDAVIRAVMSAPTLPDGGRKNAAVISRAGQVVATLSPKSYDKPTAIVDFLCPNLEACGNWAAGEYLFDVTVNDVNKTTAGTTYKFEERADVRILAIPVKGCYMGKGGGAPALESLPDEKWKKFDSYTRYVYPLDPAKVKWAVREEFDATDCTRFDLYTSDGGANLWQALSNLMPAECASNRKADGCYDLIVGFVSRNPKTDEGMTLAGFTMGKPTNIVTSTDQDAEATVAHEVAHVYGIGDTYNGGTLRCSINPGYAGITGKLWDGETGTTACNAVKHAQADATNIPPEVHPYEVGGRGALNIDANGEPVQMADYMGSSGQQNQFWTTPEVYRYLFKQLAPATAASLQALELAQQAQKLVAYSGIIRTDKGTVDLEPWETFTGSAGTQDTTGEYWIQALNAAGAQLASRKLELQEAPPAPRGSATRTMTTVPFSGVMPFPTGVAAFRIMKGTQELKKVTVSANDPVVTGVTPVQGSTTIKGEFAVNWSATDPDGDKLTYTVEYNPDSAGARSEWMVLTSGLTNADLPYKENFDELPGGTPRAQIRVIASDGVRSASAVSQLFAVAAKAPWISIDPPEWGEDYEIGDEVVLNAEVEDLQDTIFDKQTPVVWESDRDGALGTGESLIVKKLSAGSHRIVATATNSLGLKSTAQITLNIGTLSGEYIASPATRETVLTNTFTGTNTLRIPAASVTAPTFVSFTDELRPPADSNLPAGTGGWYRHFSIDFEAEKSGHWISAWPASGLTLALGALPADVALTSLKLYRWDRPDSSKPGSWKEATAECSPAGSYATDVARQVTVRVCAAGTYALTGPAALMSFPRLVNNAGEWTGLAVANPGNSPANLTFTAYENSGAPAATAAAGKNPATRSLAGGGQLSAVASELFGSSLNMAGGWIKASSDRPGLAGFFLAFDLALKTMDGTDVSGKRMTSLLFPEVADSEISLVNPGDTAADITIRLRNDAGLEQGTAVTARINALGRYAAAVSGLFPASALAGGGYLAVTSSQGLAGSQLLSKPGVTYAALNAMDTTAGARQLYCPQYVVGYGYRSTLTLINLEDAAANVSLSWIDDKGVAIGKPASFTLPALGRKVIADPALFQASLPNSGYVKVTADRRLQGSVRFGDEQGTAFDTALPMVAESRSEVIYSQVAQNETFFTGVAVINANATEARVTIGVYDTEGNLKGSGVERIAAGARISKLLPQIAPSLPAMGKGYFRVISDLPLFSFAVFGTQDFKVLSAVPPQSVGQ